MASLADLVRRRDPDRYFCALFAPAARREALFTLYAFNDELARAREVASDPTLALIRLQWWREVVEGAVRRHAVAAPLQALLAAGVLAPSPLLELLDAREADVEAPPATVELFVERMRGGPGALALAAARALGPVADPQRLRDLGAAYGIAGTLRNMMALGARQHCALPVDVLTAAGRDLLGAPRPVARTVLAAALPGALARRDFARATPVLARGIGDRLAVLWAAARLLV